MKTIIFLMLFFADRIMASSSEQFTVSTPRGESLPASLHLPDGQGPWPLLIMAPGGNYHMENPLFLRSAEMGPSQGIAVLRMDWAYCKKDPVTKKCTGKASADLSAEIEDLESVVSFIKGHAKIKAQNIVLSGKSLGTLVAYSVFLKNPKDFVALALLTPLCSDVDQNNLPVNVGKVSYPNFHEIKKPTLWLLGDNDSGATYLPHLWQFLSESPSPLHSAVVVGGNHAFSLDPNFSMDQEPNSSNLNLAIESLLKWSHRINK